MNPTLRMTMTLSIIALISALAVSSVNNKTSPVREKQKREKEARALREVLPDHDSLVKDTFLYEESPHTCWTALSADTVTAYAFRVKSPRGYAGPIEYLAGISPAGTILGLSILSQEETPGLGARMEETPSERTIWDVLLRRTPSEDEHASRPWFPHQFESISVQDEIPIEKNEGEWYSLSAEKQQELHAENTITAITGATITTKAVVSSLEEDVSEMLRILRNKGTGR
ncbi:MAG: RnfABCDGE type electron transport complex subunit G [Fibrobacterota bacterium]